MANLRTTLEVPDVYDLDANGNPIYPLEDDGTVGGAFTYNAQHMGDPPPKHLQRERSWFDFDNDDLVKAAAASAILLKGAAEAQHKRERTAAKAERKRLSDAAAANRKTLGQTAKLTNEQKMDDAQAAQARLHAFQSSSIVLPATQETNFTQAPRAQDEYVRTLAWEDSTSQPLHSQYEYGGDPAQAPTGNVMSDASGPLPIGYNDAVHGPHDGGSGEVNHEDMAQRAGFARIQQRGVAEAAEDRRMKALGKVEELRRKGLPTLAAEQEAGWAHQQEMRARGMEEENRQIQDGQIWREREDIGAAKARAELEAGEKYQESLRKQAEESRTREEARQEQENALKPAAAVAAMDVLSPDMQQHVQSLPEGDVPVVPQEALMTAATTPPPERFDDNTLAYAVAAAPGLSPEVRATMEPSYGNTIDQIVDQNPTIATTYMSHRAATGSIESSPVFLTTDAPFIAGRPTLNEGDLAYQLAWMGDEAYNEAEQRQAARQNEIDNDVDDPMKGVDSMLDANAPFRQPPHAVDPDLELEKAQERNREIATAMGIAPTDERTPLSPEEIAATQKQAKYGQEPEMDAPKLEPK